MVRAVFGLFIFGAALLVGGGILLGIGANVTNSIQNTLPAGSVAALAVANATAGIGNLAAQQPNIGTVIGAAVIIGIIFTVLFGFLAFKGGGRSE